MKRIVTHLCRLGWGKRSCAVFVLCATTAITLPAQTFTTLASFNGGNSFGPVGLIQATDGNFYGIAASYGTADDDSGFIVFKVAPSGTLTTLFSSTGEAEGEFPYGGLVQATDGYLYGTTWRGGADNCPVSGDPPGCGTAFRLSLAGTFESLHLFAKVDGTNPAAGLIQAANGTFYGTAEWGGASATARSSR